MSRFRLSPEAEHDLQSIKVFLVEQAGVAVARHVLSRLREAMRFLARSPGAGHRRDDLTEEPVKFWPVFSYLVV